VVITPVNIPELFGGCDVVVEAFDRADQKLMLIETMLEIFPHTPLVTGSGMAGWGQTQLLRCEQHGTLYVCGDQQTEVSEELSPLAPRVGIVSNMQANAVLEILLGEQDSLKIIF
jgi:sulfur carrier protein ThiS adenylyltransferase